VIGVYVISAALLGKALGVQVERVTIGFAVPRWLGVVWRGRCWEWEIGAWPGGSTKFAAKPNNPNDALGSSGEQVRYLDDLSTWERAAMLTIGPLSNFAVGVILLVVAVVLPTPQLTLTTASEGTIKPVSVSGLVLSERQTTVAGQQRFVLDISAFLAPRYGYLKSINDCGGVIGAILTCGAVAKESPRGWLTCIGTLAVINAWVNLLPIPTLNGGHLAFLSWQAIFGRPVPEKWLIRLSLIGLTMVLLVMGRILLADAMWLWRLVVA
jgi:membrane-associated protease RseP (regulator of RpoE activity)